ncbi:hypothetical protein HY213_05045 [Candidatus Peregrinibacteria bacterium]|nr:hypothetical protein [Candidatus Peregrinibacteria bacterium]
MDPQTLEGWIAGSIRSTEAKELRWVSPLYQNTAEKREVILFIVGVITFVEKKLQELLEAKKDIKTSLRFVQAEDRIIEAEKQNSEATREVTAQWLEEAGITQADELGGLMLGLLHTFRRKALLLLEHIQTLSTDAQYFHDFQKLHPFEEVRRHIHGCMAQENMSSQKHRG